MRKLIAALLGTAFVIALGVPTSAKVETVKGRLVDQACYVQDAKNTTNAHAGMGDTCAADCAKKGLPVALVTDDGKVYPLIKDTGSRMFFKDKTLLNRPMRLTGRLHPGSQMLQVINVHSYKDGKLHDIYYWCDICTIKAYENVICECCGAAMDFREVPLK